MKKAFYLRLAWDGIKKNKKLYLPYILTCVGMIAMFYIVAFLSKDESMLAVTGGEQIQGILVFGTYVLGIFSLLILFYTNSFLIRRRKKEFGLYNILGMDKINLSRVLFWENAVIFCISMVSGLACGLLFSKFAQLLMVNILTAGTDFSLSVSPDSISTAFLWFAVIFVLIFLNALRQIHMTNPADLLKSESTGEKPPKANWAIAALGALILAGAYIIAVTITNPTAAIFMYFVAVIMVILATYMLFISGSVALCKALQKNKHYYYKTNHFISVSTMAYRMKRNGAGLASICILSTMVLVMISCTVCLYTGMDDSLRTRYPRDLVIDITAAQDGSIDESIINSANDSFDSTVKENAVTPLNKISYRLSDFSANVSGNDFEIVTNGFYNSSAYNVLIVPLEDYNRLMGKNETLGENEAIAYTTKLSDYDESTININGTGELTITKYVDDYIGYGIDISFVNDSIYLFVPNYDEYIARFADITEPNGNKVMSSHYIIGSDFDCETETLYDLTEAFDESIGANTTLTSASCGFSIESIAGSLEMFMGLYGGLFFLGILLGIVFVFAAVLIMYYKQISEGYEDRSRFDIMKKVGMTEKEIKKSINSQVLTVFFAPLVMAGIHLAFNFPLINRTITLLGFTNPALLLGTTVACFSVFAVLYVIVYRITSSSYFNIVNAKAQ